MRSSVVIAADPAPPDAWDRAALAAAAQRDVDAAEVLTRFSRVVSHDFSSPLQAIHGFAVLLADALSERMDEDERSYLGEIITAAARMQALNQGLVTWVRARNTRLRLTDVNLDALVGERIADFDVRITEMGAVVTASALPVVRADAGAISVVMHQLLDNALRYADPQRPPIVDIDATDSDGDVTIVVRDNGVGIEDRNRERAFELFRRLEPERDPGRAGVGLTLSRTLIERHGGRLRINNGAGGGSEAVFNVPAFVEPVATEPGEIGAVTGPRQHMESRIALGAIVESAEDAIVSYDLDGLILTWNGAAERLYGYTATEMIGTPATRLLAPEQRVEIPMMMDKLRTGTSTRRQDTVQRRKDGTLVEVAVTISPMRDVQGRIAGASFIARDITERHRTEEDLRAFLEVAPDAIVVIDREGAIKAVNTQAEATFGYTADELVGKPVEMLVPERYRGAHAKHVLAFTAEPKLRPMGTGLEFFGLRRDGTEFPVDIQLSSLPTKDGIMPVAAIRDVTERRRLEHLRDDFVANAAHELRTPLTTLAGLGETLARSFDVMARPDIEDAFAAMARQGERARVLISNLLDLSNIEGGRTNFTIVDVDILPLVNGVLEAAPPPDGKSVTVAVPGNLRVHADSARLEQVVSNLLVNAYRYGGPAIRIDAVGDGTWVVFSVCDDGSGIEPDLISKLFEPFTRGRQASVVRGSGIGLALCRRILQGMDGHIRYEPMAPRGSCFRVVLRQRP